MSVVLVALAVLSPAAALERADVNLLVVSDLGAFGGADQPAVAETLGDVATEFGPTAIVNLGDTFHFWGVQSTDDPGWNSNFENLYTAPALHNLWYCALGNHDYQGNTTALLDYTDKSRRWNMPARYYTQRFKSRGTTVELIVLDTTPFLRRTQSCPEMYPDVAAQDTAAQTQWLRQALAQADADWVIVAAHHPVYSCRPDNAGQRADIQAHIAPILAERRPDFYISGDVHCFEHYTFDGDTTDYVTCTSGSQGYPIITPDASARFGTGVSGFMTIAAAHDNCTVTMFDLDGNELYTYTRRKEPSPQN